jgi:hypothetical protein
MQAQGRELKATCPTDFPTGKISGLPDFLSSPFAKNILIFRICDSVYIAPVPFL